MRRITLFLWAALSMIPPAVVGGCLQKVSSSPTSSSSPTKPTGTTARPVETTLPAAAARQSSCQLKLLTEPAAIRRGDPAGLLVGPPRVRVDGCPRNPMHVKLFVDVPNHEAILKKEADNIRIFPVSELADSAFRVRTIRVKLEAECAEHQTHAEAVWNIRVYPRDAVVEPPAEKANASSTAPMASALGDQPKPRPQQPLHARPSPLPTKDDPPVSRPPVAIMIEAPTPGSSVRGGQLLLVRGKATLPPDTTMMRLQLLDDTGRTLAQATCQVAEDGSFVGTLALPSALPPAVVLEVRAGAVVSRVRLRGR